MGFLTLLALLNYSSYGLEALRILFFPFSLFFQYNFIYLFMAMLGSVLRGLFSSCSKQEQLFIAVLQLLIVGASLVVDPGL